MFRKRISWLTGWNVAPSTRGWLEPFSSDLHHRIPPRLPEQLKHLAVDISPTTKTRSTTRPISAPLFMTFDLKMDHFIKRTAHKSLLPKSLRGGEAPDPTAYPMSINIDVSGGWAVLKMTGGFAQGTVTGEFALSGVPDTSISFSESQYA